MLYKKQIEKDLIQVGSLKNLIEIYGEIASVRMMKIRGFVLKNRQYLESISDIFQDALRSYAKKLSELVKTGKLKKGGRVTFLAHNGKTVCVLVSANTGFYGDVIQSTFRKFLSDIRQKDVEITVIGKLGRILFIKEKPKTPFTYFDFPDYGMDKAKLTQIINHLVFYEEIRIYYGKFQSVVTQTPAVSAISAGTPISERVEDPKIWYLFEPSVEKILTFFETEIFASLFDQSIRESQLAKFASRILAMDRAGENIKDHIKMLELKKLMMEHRIANKKQLNSFASSMFIN